MALVAYQTKGYSTLTARSRPCSRGVNLGCSVAFQLIGRTEKLASLKHLLHFRKQAIILLKEKPFDVSSFKSNGQNIEANDIYRNSEFPKKSVHLSCAPEREQTLAASSDIASNGLPYTSENGEVTATRSQPIQKLFNKWLILLRSQALHEAMEEIHTGRPAQSNISEDQGGPLRQKAENMWKTAFLCSMKLDATIKIPLLIFFPWYLITRVFYGVEVTRELTPLWVFGPLIAALYIKLIQGLCSLYIFCFKKSARFLEQVTIYYMQIPSCVAEGKPEKFLYAHFCGPIANVRNMDYKERGRQISKQLKEWASEKYLDYVESIWPYYCRTIRFLKKANLF